MRFFKYNKRCYLLTKNGWTRFGGNAEDTVKKIDCGSANKDDSLGEDNFDVDALESKKRQTLEEIKVERNRRRALRMRAQLLIKAEKM